MMNTQTRLITHEYSSILVFGAEERLTVSVPDIGTDAEEAPNYMPTPVLREQRGESLALKTETRPPD